MRIDRQPRPRFSREDARRAVAELFGLEGRVEELPGERDRNFLFRESTGGRFVLKVCNPADSDEDIDFQNQIVARLSSTNSEWEWPEPQPTLDGELIARATNRDGEEVRIRLLSYVDGVSLANYRPHSARLMSRLGRFLGSVTQSLGSFSHTSMNRELFWDMKHGIGLVRTHLDEIENERDRDLVGRFLTMIEDAVLPTQENLRIGVIYNDANDHNILIHPDDDGDGKIVGAIDFGDTVHSWLAAEPAVACAYAMLAKPDPLAAARKIVEGFHQIFPLTEVEISVLFPLVCLRSCMTVTIAAHQKLLEPDNPYLSVSEASAWKLLGRLSRVSPQFAHFCFRDACGLEPSPSSHHLTQWITDHSATFSKVVDVDLSSQKMEVLDLSIGSAAFKNGSWEDVSSMNHIIGEVSLGRYNEARMIYTSELFLAEGNERNEWRTVHLGIDVFLPAGSPVFAPLDGEVHAVRNNEGKLDHGPTVILRHSPPGVPPFFTLYGHLDRGVLESLEEGENLGSGEKIGRIGTEQVNGGWPPHLHFQIVTDLLNYDGDFPGVAKPSERSVRLSISPEPSRMLGIRNGRAVARERSPEEISESRHTHLGPTLSLSYRKPLKIVRGWMQYLYDHEGRRYLDAVNNVPHVGHSHPRVVEAIQKQSAVLNTNTRYLHENMTRLAERIVTTMPEPLSVCFFVNSGSEANDVALRLAAAHTGGRDIITVEGAYHGNLSSLIDISPYKFEGPGGTGMPAHVQMVPMPDSYRGAHKYGAADSGKLYAESVKKAIDRIRNRGGKVSAFICESMISSGGLIVLPEHYLATAYEHIHNAGGVCIADEVVVGFGRVGSHFWGFETQSVVPDIVTLGKPMGNGHPIAAVVTTPEIAASFDTGMEYFNTYGGNPVSCAAALAVLDVLEEQKLQEHAAKVGHYLHSELRLLHGDHPLIGDVRGSGFFIGVELVKDRDSLEPAPEHAAYIAERLKERGILISTDGLHRNVLKIRPPMIFSLENAESLVSTLDDVLRETFCQKLAIIAH